MILIEDILISEDVIKKEFACNLSACKGACCIEGDFGAPLQDKEVLLISQFLEEVMPYLPRKSQEYIKSKGYYTENEDKTGYETELMPDGACVFMGRDELGITYCGIEKAQLAGDIEYKKPISCHLYPLRATKNELTGFEALNYDIWDICSAACTQGEKQEIKIYEFVKTALIRAYGESFYEELEAAAQNYYKNKKSED